MKKIISTTAVLIFLVGCGKTTETTTPTHQETAAVTEDDEPPTELETPEDRALSVVVKDSAPLTMYYNYDDENCYTKSALENATEPAPTITIRDETDTIIATETAEEFGGEFTGDGCRINTYIEKVPTSEYYQVELEGEGQIFEIIVEEDGEPVVFAEFDL